MAFSLLAVLYEAGLLLEWHRTKVNLEIHFVALGLRIGQLLETGVIKYLR